MRALFASALSLSLCVPASPSLAASALDYDLAANAPAAHRYVAGVVADAAAPGFVKYARDPKRKWKYLARVDGRTVALGPGRQVRLWIPAGPELGGQKLKLVLGLKPFGKQRLDIFVQGKKVHEGELEPGWQTVKAVLPRGLVKEGFARVRLYFARTRSVQGMRTAAALRFVHLAAAAAPDLPVQEAALARIIPRVQGRTLVIPKGSGLDYYITPVKGLTLRGQASGGRVEVWGQLDGKRPVKLAAGSTLSVSMDRFAGQAVRLMVRASGGDLRLSGARLAGARPGDVRVVTKPKRVIFWLIDALRADKWDVYGKRGSKRPKVKTPNLTALAREGAVFDPFWVNSNESKAGHASFWTGTYPTVHRVVNQKASLKTKFLTIAEAFRGAGYRTAALVSNGYISKRWHYDQGFQSMRNFIREGVPSGAEHVVDTAIPWLKKHKDQPFYLYLGTSDTHVTYRAHKEFIKQYDPKPYAGPYRRFVAGTTLGKIKARSRPPSRRNRQRIEALYENEFAWNDKHFGRLVAKLKELGIYKDTLFIISADHGEEFWEHGSCGHGHSLYRELVSVPFVLRWPGVIPAGVTVRSGHDGTDLLPTLLSALGVKQPDQIQGETLFPFVGAKNVYPRAMVASRDLTMFTLRTGPSVVILRGAQSVRVYDLANDPREQHDLYRKRLVLSLAGLDPLTLFVQHARTWHKARWGVANNLTPAFADDLVK